jgi:hypothetical protein
MLLSPPSFLSFEKSQDCDAPVIAANVPERCLHGDAASLILNKFAQTRTKEPPGGPAALSENTSALRPGK